MADAFLRMISIRVRRDDYDALRRTTRVVLEELATKRSIQIASPRDLDRRLGGPVTASSNVKES